MAIHWTWFRAALINDQTTLWQGIKQGWDVNQSDCLGNTALHLAAYKGHEACVKLLICYGAYVDFSNDRDQTPLDLAVEYQHPCCVTQLLQQCAQVTGRALHIAASCGSTDILFALLQMRPTAIEQASRCARNHGHHQLANQLATRFNDDRFCSNAVGHG